MKTAALIMSFALVACGSSTKSPAGSEPDASARHDASVTPEAGTVIQDCFAGGTCPAGSTCLFEIGTCQDSGKCIEDPAPGTPICKAIQSLCGCNGYPATTGCGYPSGYATGPTTGGAGNACGDAGSPTPEAGAPACPATMPSAGSTCAVTFQCEYGSDPDVDCDTVMACATGHWAFSSMPSTTACSTTSSASCPATFADLGADKCTSASESCFYPEARCACSSQCGPVGQIGPDGGPELSWCCPDAPEEGPQCPSPRPRLGTPCAAATGIQCDYGGCSGNVTLECTGGVWVEATMVGCPG
jgi:hypothetical protein